MVMNQMINQFWFKAIHAGCGEAEFAGIITGDGQTLKPTGIADNHFYLYNYQNLYAVVIY